MRQSFAYNVLGRVYHDLASALLAGGAVNIDLSQTVVVDFHSVHEIIGDLLRNPCQKYKIVACYCDACDDLARRVVEPYAELSDLIGWIIRHGAECESGLYSYNRKKKTGIYCLHCNIDKVSADKPISYQITELE